MKDEPRLEAWLDGQLGAEEAREVELRVLASPELQADVERARAIEQALRRQFLRPSLAGSPPISNLSLVPRSRRMRRASSWLGFAVAAGLLALMGAGWWLRERGASPLEPAPIAASSACELDRVFCDALSRNFQPLTGCASTTEWDSRLLASLGAPTCNSMDPLVVLGEWNDPRLDVSDIVMLRVGLEPVMLLVPRGERAASLCLPRSSPLHLHRGKWEGRELYELSNLAESRVLECVQAEGVRLVRF